MIVGVIPDRTNQRVDGERTISTGDESTETPTRPTQEDATARYLQGHGVDDWDKVTLLHYMEDDVWKARLDGTTAEGLTKTESLGALVKEIRLQADQ